MTRIKSKLIPTSPVQFDTDPQRETLSGSSEESRGVPDPQEHIIQLLKRETARCKRLPEAEVRALLISLGKLDPASEEFTTTRNRIIEHFSLFAMRTGLRFRSHLHILDKLSIALLILCKVVPKLDPHANPPSWRGYIETAIERGLIHAAAHQTRPVKLDYGRWYKLRNKRDESEALSFDRKNYIKSSELSEDEAAFVNAFMRNHPSLFDTVSRDATGEDSDLTFEDTLPQSMFGRVDDSLIRDEEGKRGVAELIQNARPALTQDELVVLRLKWGLLDGVERSNNEVALALNLSLVRTNQLHDQAIKKLRRGVTTPEVDNLERSAMWKLREGVKRGKAA